jgi:hypothetical protein
MSRARCVFLDLSENDWPRGALDASPAILPNTPCQRPPWAIGRGRPDAPTSRHSVARTRFFMRASGDFRTLPAGNGSNAMGTAVWLPVAATRLRAGLEIRSPRPQLTSPADDAGGVRLPRDPVRQCSGPGRQRQPNGKGDVHHHRRHGRAVVRAHQRARHHRQAASRGARTAAGTARNLHAPRKRNRGSRDLDRPQRPSNPGQDRRLRQPRHHQPGHKHARATWPSHRIADAAFARRKLCLTHPGVRSSALWFLLPNSSRTCEPTPC